MSTLAILVACLDLLGWWWGLVSLVRVIPLPSSGIMMPNTAVGLVLTPLSPFLPFAGVLGFVPPLARSCWPSLAVTGLYFLATERMKTRFFLKE